jgi:hypothetical protein
MAQNFAPSLGLSWNIDKRKSINAKKGTIDIVFLFFEFNLHSIYGTKNKSNDSANPSNVLTS